MSRRTPSDLNLETGLATIYKGARRGTEGPTKENRSKVVAVTSGTAEVLRKHIASLMAQHHPNSKGLVFPNDVGGYLTSNSLDWAIEVVRAAVGKRITPHGLRHTSGTHLAMDGETAEDQAAPEPRLQ